MMDENTYISEVLLPSFEKAGELFQEEGIETLPALSPEGDPGLLLLSPPVFEEEGGDVLISCRRMDSGERELYRYMVSHPDYDPWVFPCLYSPEEFEGLPLLPLLYRYLLPGEPDNRREDSAAELYGRIRLPYLRDCLSELGLDTALLEKPDGTAFLLGEEAGSPVRLSVEIAFPEWQASILRIETGTGDALIPEFGAPMEREDYASLLSAAFDLNIID